MISRLVRMLVPGAMLAVACATGAFAQTQPLQGIPGTANPVPSPDVKKALALPDTLSPQSHPAPTPTPLPGHLTFSGKVRGYYFRRLNRIQNAPPATLANPNPAGNPNRHAIAFSFSPHIDYRIGDTPLNIGYTYGGSTGFGFNGPNPIKNGNVDNTLPGYALDQPIEELYVQYKDKNNQITIGNQILNYAFMPNSDSRMLPSSYQAADANVKLASWLTASLTREIRYEARNSSNFANNTNLTAPYPQNSGTTTQNPTNGTMRVGLTIKPSARSSILAENYQFYDLTNLVYAEGKYGLDPYSAANPYIAAQYVAENSLGAHKVENVDNHTIGAQLGANVAKGLLFTASTDLAQWHYADVNALSAAAATKGYFAPSGGTGTAKLLPNGQYRIAYGGIASPFTDSFATDPLYTTQITQGMADRRSAGESYKTALVYTTPSKQLKLIASEGWFDYSNQISRNLTSEFNADATYFFSKVKSGPYKGLFVRVRFAPRQQPSLPYEFQYERFQAEYDL